MSASLTTGNYQNLRLAAQDRLHQQYRMSLIPGAEQAMRLMDDGAYCTYISGAGSTLMALLPGNNEQYVRSLREKLDGIGLRQWKIIRLNADNTGAVCLESRSFNS